MCKDISRGDLKSTMVLFFFLGLVGVAWAQGKVVTPKQYAMKVVETLPHERSGYTQGLFFYNNQLYESTGQYGESSFRKVDLTTGKVLRRLSFDSKYFVEGSCVLDGRLYVLTWKEKKCFVYDLESLKYLGELHNPREGWGLTTNGTDLIMSDGSNQLFFLDPMTFLVRKTVSVTLKGKPLPYLNELELINGEIWANVYGEDYIAIINPESGVVTGFIDCRNLLPASLRDGNTDVLNGIAYNPTTQSIYLTGKYWPRLYRIQVSR